MLLFTLRGTCMSLPRPLKNCSALADEPRYAPASAHATCTNPTRLSSRLREPLQDQKRNRESCLCLLGTETFRLQKLHFTRPASLSSCFCAGNLQHAALDEAASIRTNRTCLAGFVRQPMKQSMAALGSPAVCKLIRDNQSQ